MSTYVVQQGDHLSGIAKSFGFEDFHTIWEHPSNAALKAKRNNPHVIFPGDQLFIPDKRPKTESVATTKVHRFRFLAAPLKLRIAVRDFDDQPITQTPCQLEVEGAVYNLTTDGKGLIEHAVPKTAKMGKLKIPKLDLELPVKIGHLDPVDENTGQRGRLANLGYDLGDDSQLRYAVEEFQCDHGLTVSGELDGATRSKLRDLHGS